ncbi:MAG: gamma-glutamyltransferase family protein, partial [Alphaproteobacteria bacterium]
MPSARPTLYGSRHAVSAGHYLAAAAGFSILEAGGNAIDAGCAAGIALAVLHPDEVKVAGVAPIMIRTGEGKVVTIAGLGHWPKRFPADLFMREHGGKMPLGLLRTVVPAAPDAWITALSDWGTMTFGDVASAAIRYAREGFAVFDYMATMIKEYEQGYRSWPSNAAIFLPGGNVPKVGDRFLQTDLAGTLQYMVDQERAASSRGRLAGLAAARAAFYCGDIAETIVRYHEQNGGYLARDDLANFHSRYEEPVKVRWRDFEVYTCGPWCQGPMLAQAL